MSGEPPRCDVCHWTNVNLLNIGETGGEPFWICHGCIKRKYDELTTTKRRLDIALAILEQIERGCLDPYWAGWARAGLEKAKA